VPLIKARAFSFEALCSGDAAFQTAGRPRLPTRAERSDADHHGEIGGLAPSAMVIALLATPAINERREVVYSFARGLAARGRADPFVQYTRVTFVRFLRPNALPSWFSAAADRPARLT
jgi:hypothetical protein